MADIDLSPENVSMTKAYINSSGDQTSSLGGYKMSKGHLIGLPNFMNYNTAEVRDCDIVAFVKVAIKYEFSAINRADSGSAGYR